MNQLQDQEDNSYQAAMAWALQLDTWIQENGLRGFDPFDVKQHPWLRAAQPYRLPRRATTALCDLFPNAMRRLLGTAPRENAKSFALVAYTRLRLYALTQEKKHLDDALACLEWLLAHAATGWNGLC